ncbi:MAG TPA: peptidase MA family metallohydrolase [Syntrophales bacterium]|nr:peptidase MA family metallohydrolase [Syntrophales bacterium]
MVLILFFVYCLCPGCHAEEDIGTLQTHRITVYFEKQLETSAREIVAIYPGVLAELEDLLGWDLGYRPTVFLDNNRDRFEKMAGSDLFVAMAVPQKKLIIIDHSRMIHPFTLRTTLKHELCHLILHRHIREATLPRWFDEGIAQWTSDGLAEIIMKSDRLVLNRAVLMHHYIRLEDLHRYFPRNKNALQLAYEESKNIVEYIIRDYGVGRLLRILYALEGGKDIDTAISDSLFISLDELETEWLKHLRQRVSWVLLLNAYLYQILFFLAALLLAIAGSVKLLKQRRARLQEYEDDDEDNPSGWQ